MRWKLALVALLTLVFLAAVMHGLDLDLARQALAATSWPVVLAGTLLYIPLHLMRSGRLWLLLGGQNGAGQRLSYGRVVSINAIGFLAINVIPLRLGEAVRPWLLHEREGISWGRCLAAIVMERIQDFAALLVMLLGVSFLVELPAEGIVVQGVDVLRAGQRVAGTFLVLGVIGGTLVMTVGEPVLSRIERLPMGKGISSLFRRFREGISELLRRPLLGLVSLLLTVAIWGTTLASVAVILSSMPGLPVSLASAWTTWTLTLTGMTAVPTPGFFGAYELFCSAALWLFGVDAHLARTFAVVLHLSQFSFTLVAGATGMLIEGVGARQLLVRPQGRPAEADPGPAGG